jgi:hypothetical protein
VKIDCVFRFFYADFTNFKTTPKSLALYSKTAMSNKYEQNFCEGVEYEALSFA